MRSHHSRWRALFLAAGLASLGAPAWSFAQPIAPEPPAAAAGQPADAAALDPATLLLFSLTLDDLTLSEGLGAYGEPTDPLLPMGEVVRLLEADIDVYPSERRIVGRLGEARRSLLVDIGAGVARVGGAAEVKLAAEDYAVTATEVYLRASLVRKLLPLTIEVSPEELAIEFHALERFPVQARLQRQARRPDGSIVAGADDQALTVVEPYRFFSFPGADVVLDAGDQSNAQGRTFRYDLRIAGDLLWSNLQAFVASDEEGRATDARISLQRRSLEGRLLGPLHVREITAGDTYSPGLPLGPRSVSGRGISLSSVPLEQTNIFNRIDLRGELPPGFDVELYVNDVLNSSTNQSVNGRYEFLNVPLAPGINVLRIVTYGPRGERTEEVQVINIGAGLLRPGEVTFTFGAIDQDQPLLRLRRVDSVSFGQPGLFAESGTRIVGGFNIGVTDRLTAAVGGARILRPDGVAIGILNVGARTSIMGLATQFDAAWDDEKGRAASIGLAGAYGGVSGILRHAEYDGRFLDENNLAAAPLLELERRTELTLDASIDLRGRILPVSLRVIRDGYADGSNDLLAGVRGSTSVGAVLLSAGYEYNRQNYRASRTIETLDGYLTASTYRGYKWQIRTTFDYEVIPDLKARYLTLSIDRRLSDRWSLHFALGQPLDRTSNSWNALVSSIFQTRVGDLAITGEYDNRAEDWRVAAQWSFGLGYNPARNAYELMRTGPGSGGSVLLDAYDDRNGNGIRELGEAPIPNVAIQGGHPREIRTGADGRAYVTGLGMGPTARLDVSLDHVDNPTVVTPPTRLNIRPRPGNVARVNYPMRPTGEVMVRVELLRDDGQKVGLSSVRVQMVPGAGEPHEAVTEFDGSAIFEGLPVAGYRLQLEPRQAEKLRMRLLESPTVTIRGDGTFTPDVVVQVRFDPPPAAAAEPAKGAEK